MKKKNTLFDALKREDLAKLNLVQESLQKEELQRFKFTTSEYERIVHYCGMLGYLSQKVVNGKIQTNKKGEIVYSSPSINEQMKTIKIFNSKNHRWGYLQKLKKGIFYGYFMLNDKGNSVFVPKYNFESNLQMFEIFKRMNCNDICKMTNLDRLKASAGIMELEVSS